MNNVTRAKNSVPLLLLLAVLIVVPVSAQNRPYPNDFSGHWVPLFHEDDPDRGTGPALGQYEEMPINDDARARAMTWDACTARNDGPAGRGWPVGDGVAGPCSDPATPSSG